MGSFSISEILTILVVILVIFGPNRLPEFARKTGQLIAQARKAVASFTAEFEGEYGDAVNPIRDITDELGGIKQDLTRTVTNLGAVVGGDVAAGDDKAGSEAPAAQHSDGEDQHEDADPVAPIAEVPDAGGEGADRVEPETTEDLVADVTTQPEATDGAEDTSGEEAPDSESGDGPSSDDQAGEVA
jgi:TatA/E family protein of Tat protein translocase